MHARQFLVFSFFLRFALFICLHSSVSARKKSSCHAFNHIVYVFFSVNVSLSLSLLYSESCLVERREQFISMLDALLFYTIFTEARACILIHFFFLFFVLNFVFLDNYFPNVRCNICCQKFFSDEMRFWYGIKWKKGRERDGRREK